MSPSNSFRNALPQVKHCLLSYPTAGVLLATINRPKALNSLDVEASYELDSVFRWFDEEPSLKVAVITGAGKAFCVGADLKGTFKDLLPQQCIETSCLTQYDFARMDVQ